MMTAAKRVAEAHEASRSAPADEVVAGFRARFGVPPALLVRAPGRVNLIGEHTDYNDGFVLPLAIERAVWIALRPRPDAVVDVRSLEYADAAHFDTRSIVHGGPPWGEYVRGVASALRAAGYPLHGWEGVLSSDVPIGAGLSSSAALELAVARAFAAAAGFPWDAPAMARLAQRAENRWVGMNCGIMDQMISAVGRQGHAVLIDCRSLDTAPVPLPPDCVVVILDTTTRRGLVDSAYNERRRQCEAAAAHFGVPALRDLSVGELSARAHELDTTTARRARHVVTENERTLAAADAMRSGDAARLGSLMNESHASMRDDFEISTTALDTMTDIARAQDGCYGARMTGGGFGGCGVALVRTTACVVFTDTVARGYERRTGLHPRVYVTSGADGASVIDLAGSMRTESSSLPGRSHTGDEG